MDITREITREEAKRILEFDLDHTYNDESKEALRMAIKALEQECCEDAAKECYEDLCEYFGGAKDILKHREDFKAWLGRVRWHIHKAEELSAENDDLRDQLAMRDRFQKQEPCEDAIRRQAVLDLAKKGVLVSNGNYESVCKAINEIPSVNLMPCEDSISRQAVLDIVDSYSESQSNVEDVTQDIISDIVVLPSINPTKTGYWIETETDDPYWYRCSRCNRRIDDRENYCPNCGCRMFEPQESEG